MPIPTGGAWPPPEMAEAYQAYQDWDAWYAGSPAKLRQVYRNRSVDGDQLPPSQRVRSGQYAGGLVGTVSRWLWGAPPVAGQRDGRIHVPMPSDLSAAKAGLLFSEPPKLVHPATAVQKRLEQLEEDGLWQRMRGGADGNSAFGDLYLRPAIDLEVFTDRAFLTTVHADGAIPVIRWDQLIEVTFWQKMAVDGSKVYRLLEHHEVVDGLGRIVYRLHEGTTDKLGGPVPFTALSSTAYLAGEQYPEGIQLTGLKRLDVVRIPNGGPQRLWRTEPALKYLGRSDYDGAEPWFDRADEAWTGWLLDLKNARGKIIVPDYMLQSAGAGQGATWNADQEVFRGMTMLPNQVSGTGITAVQFAIRHEEHKATLDALYEVIWRHAGLSAQTMGEQGGDVAMTATESQARERRSFTTRGEMIPVYSQGIADACELLMELEAVQFPNRGGPVGRPSVQFADSVTEAPETVARTIQLLDSANAMSVWTKVRTLHPDWTEPEVQEEVDRIKGDQSSVTVTNPDTFTGAGDEGDEDQADEPDDEAAADEP